jgi:hypothetical protein
VKEEKAIKGVSREGLTVANDIWKTEGGCVHFNENYKGSEQPIKREIVRKMELN